MSPTMTRNIGEDAFKFVNITDVYTPQDPAARKLIRKQAMVHVAAARRQKTSHRKRKNLQQCQASAKCQRPILDSDSPEVACERTDKAITNKEEKDLPSPLHAESEEFKSCLQLSRTGSIPASLTSVGYESMKIQYDFDILDLSALTGFHTNRATAHALFSDPARLMEILRCKQWSYISFLPSRFGHVPCLDDAVRCVAAQVRYRLSAPKEPLSPKVLALYSRALASLQAALEDPYHCLQPEVLCATEMLAIYEVGK